MMSELYTATSSATYRVTSAASSAASASALDVIAHKSGTTPAHSAAPSRRTTVARSVAALDLITKGSGAAADPPASPAAPATSSVSFSHASFARCWRSSAANSSQRSAQTCCRTP